MAIKNSSWILGASLAVLAVVWAAWTLYNSPGKAEKKASTIVQRSSLSDESTPSAANRSAADSNLASGLNVQSGKINSFDPALSKAVEAINRVSIVNTTSTQTPRALNVVPAAVPLAQKPPVNATRTVNVPKVSRPAI